MAAEQQRHHYGAADQLGRRTGTGQGTRIADKDDDGHGVPPQGEVNGQTVDGRESTGRQDRPRWAHSSARSR